jgi:hypothetical protein
MLCKKKSTIVLMILSLIAAQGCGVFGKKQDPSSTLLYQTANAGCLDNIGTQVKQYSNGTISETDLTGAWNCVSSSLTLFGQFIRGSVPNGYTPDDIQLFISHFMYSQGTISMDLVNSVFALKASLFGGTADVVTLDEIGNLLNLITILQTETTQVLPHLADRAQNPTPKNLIALSESIRRAGKHIGASLQTAGNPSFNAADIQTLVNELQSLTASSTSVSPQIGQFVVSIKQILALGGSDGIEGSAWPTLVQSLFSYLGPALSALSYQPTLARGANAEDGFFTKIVGQLTESLDATIKINGTGIPFSAMSNMIQYVPPSFLTAEQGAAVIGILPAAFTRILQSKTPNAIDLNVTTTLMTQIKFWDKVESILNKMYTQNGFDTEVGPTSNQLIDALTALYPPGQTTPDIDAVNWIAALIQNYSPYFAGEDQEISFSGLTSYSMHDMGMKHLIRLISTMLLKGYNSGTDPNEIDNADFSTFVNDVVPILNAWKMSDPSLPSATQARFLQANLFMPSSNGDNYVSLDEGSQYILYFLSIYQGSARADNLVASDCPSYGLDAYGTSYMSADCFRKTYFSNHAVFWDRMPRLTKFYDSLDATDQADFEVAVETASRYYGYSNQCVGLGDVEGFSGILHYIETILERFDTDGDGLLDTTEAMGAFPTFQNELITAGKSSGLSATNTGEQQAAFAYALAKGKLPKGGVAGDVEFVWWWLIVGKSHWDLKAPRNNLYKVLSNISPPVVPTMPSQCL